MPLNCLKPLNHIPASIQKRNLSDVTVKGPILDIVTNERRWSSSLKWNLPVLVFQERTLGAFQGTSWCPRYMFLQIRTRTYSAHRRMKCFLSHSTRVIVWTQSGTHKLTGNSGMGGICASKWAESQTASQVSSVSGICMGLQQEGLLTFHTML